MEQIEEKYLIGPHYSLTHKRTTFNIEISAAVCSAQCEVLVPAEKVGRRVG